MAKKRMMLYFGSFNPIHTGHIEVAEYAIEKGLCDQLALVISPQNPLKDKREIVPEHQRFEMAEIACSESRFAGQITPSVIEFLLPKPSYTINTLRHLSEEYGEDFEFSILMGGDIIEQFHLWKDYEEILANYNIYVYPRPNEKIERYLDKITVIEGAPMFNISSSELRQMLGKNENTAGRLHPKVLEYIRKNDLWSEESYLDTLAAAIDKGDISALRERAKLHYRHQRWGKAINDLSKILEKDPSDSEAQGLKTMAEEILEYKYVDQFNP